MSASTISSVLFPILGSYPSVLNFGTSSSAPRNTEGQQLLFVLDGTGSMGEFINEKHECSKAVMAKRLITNVLERSPGLSHDVMVFNTSAHPLCKVTEIPAPADSTYFSPLVPALKETVLGKNYAAVVFFQMVFLLKIFLLLENLLRQLVTLLVKLRLILFLLQLAQMLMENHVDFLQAIVDSIATSSMIRIVNKLHQILYKEFNAIIMNFLMVLIFQLKQMVITIM